MKLVEKIEETLIVLVFLALNFCGLDFAIWNFKNVVTSSGFTAIIHFLIGTISVAIFIGFMNMVFEAIKEAITK